MRHLQQPRGLDQELPEREGARRAAPRDDFIPHFENIEVEYAPGETREVTLHDGSRIVLRKLEEDYDPGDPLRALQIVHQGRDQNRFVTGLLYLNPGKLPLDTEMNLVDEPLASLPLERVRPPKSVLDGIMAGLMTGTS